MNRYTTEGWDDGSRPSTPSERLMRDIAALEANEDEMRRQSEYVYFGNLHVRKSVLVWTGVLWGCVLVWYVFAAVFFSLVA